MHASLSPPAEVDLHQLDLRFAGTRLQDPTAVVRLAGAIERDGQIVPCVAVAVPESTVPPRWVVVDGYRRIDALRRLRRDTALIQIWRTDLPTALIGILAQAAARSWTPIEEALLLRELIQSLGLSERQVAQRCGRDVSWVSRRLQLVLTLPEPILEAVRLGKVSTWAATRILGPLARANSSDAERVLRAIEATPMATRDLKRWFQQYQRVPRPVRENLVADPHLFVRTVHRKDDERADARLRGGPEAQCLQDCQRLRETIERLRRQLMIWSQQPWPEGLHSAFVPLCRDLADLHHELQRGMDHDSGCDRPEHRHAAPARPQQPQDSEPAEAVA
jgi:ParB family transcriptional regulator, chromosome partitioning protein